MISIVGELAIELEPGSDVYNEEPAESPSDCMASSNLDVSSLEFNPRK